MAREAINTSAMERTQDVCSFLKQSIVRVNIQKAWLRKIAMLKLVHRTAQVVPTRHQTNFLNKTAENWIMKKFWFVLAIAWATSTPAKAEETVKEFGDWKVVYKENGFGEKSAYIKHQIDVKQGMQISCKQGNFIAIIKHEDPVNWTLPTIKVRYKIGDEGPIVKEEWKHNHKLDFTVMENAGEFVNYMSSRSGKFVFSVLMTEFSASLDGFAEAISEVKKVCH